MTAASNSDARKREAEKTQPQPDLHTAIAAYADEVENYGDNPMFAAIASDLRGMVEAERGASNSESGLSRPRGSDRGTDGVETPNGAQRANLSIEQMEALHVLIVEAGFPSRGPEAWAIASRISDAIAGSDWLAALLLLDELERVREHRAEAWDEGWREGRRPLGNSSWLLSANPYRGADHA